MTKEKQTAERKREQFQLLTMLQEALLVVELDQVQPAVVSELVVAAALAAAPMQSAESELAVALK